MLRTLAEKTHALAPIRRETGKYQRQSPKFDTYDEWFQIISVPIIIQKGEKQRKSNSHAHCEARIRSSAQAAVSVLLRGSLFASPPCCFSQRAAVLPGVSVLMSYFSRDPVPHGSSSKHPGAISYT